MPIDARALKRDLILVDERATVRHVRDRVLAGGDVWAFVVVPLPAGGFAVLRWDELVAALDRHAAHAAHGGQPPADSLGSALGDLPGLLEARRTEAVEREAMSTDQARRRVAEAPGRRLVVLDGHAVAGVLVLESRSAWRPSVGPVVDASLNLPRISVLDVPPVAEPALAPPPAPLPPPSPPAAPAAPVPSDAATPLQPEERWINAAIEAPDPTAPLQVARVYTLAFDVDTVARPGSSAAAPFGYDFAPDAQMVALTVQLVSDDFEIHSGPQELRVPRRGPSKSKARFDVEPKHEGEGVLRATFTKDGNLIQVLTVRLRVGAPGPQGAPGGPALEALGRPVGAAFVVQPRDVTLTILNTGTGFQVIMCSAVCAVASLPITPQQLEQMVSEVRGELQAIVHLEVGPQRRLLYQAGIDIPADVNRLVLQRLARAGMRLFQRLFYGPAADLQANRLGDALRALAQRERLKIQIFAQQFPLPWGVLYMAEEFDPERIDPELFLGFKHVIECIPLQPGMGVLERAIASHPTLTVSLNVNTDIDGQLGSPIVADQMRYWEQVGRRSSATTIVRKSGAEVTRALTDPTTPDQILYFYCHATSTSLSETGGPDASSLMLSGGQRLTLEDLHLQAPPQRRLPGAPLVFINACELAELSPLFYEGFVPYFMQKGARGVIGTECETPARFAAEWARRFFDLFLSGMPLGQALLELRRAFLFGHQNVLGLLYALYCDGDTLIDPALPASTVS